jgi:hypothetical protein
MSFQAPAAKTPPDDSGLSIVTVAAATASGIGVLGFVTFAGGVVLWARFRQMGLQADRALSIVPSSELVATGAEFLVPALLTAAVSLLAMLGVDLWIREWPSMRATTTKRRRQTSALLTATVALTAEMVVVAISGAVGILQIVVLVGIAALSAIVIMLSRPRLGLAAFSLVAFLAVGIFWLARAYVVTVHDPKVVPMAYSRKPAGAATNVEYGYFVAETSDRIFYAAAPSVAKDARNELREFPRAETDDLEIGDLTKTPDAQKGASLLAFNLCYRLYFVKAGASTANAKSAKGCNIETLRTYETQAGKPLTPLTGQLKG